MPSLRKVSRRRTTFEDCWCAIFFTDCTHALRASRYPTEETILTAIERVKMCFVVFKSGDADVWCDGNEF